MFFSDTVLCFMFMTDSRTDKINIFTCYHNILRSCVLFIIYIKLAKVPHIASKTKKSNFERKNFNRSLVNSLDLYFEIKSQFLVGYDRYFVSWIRTF